MNSPYGAMLKWVWDKVSVTPRGRRVRFYRYTRRSWGLLVKGKKLYSHCNQHSYSIWLMFPLATTNLSIGKIHLTCKVTRTGNSEWGQTTKYNSLPFSYSSLIFFCSYQVCMGIKSILLVSHLRKLLHIISEEVYIAPKLVWSDW